MIDLDLILYSERMVGKDSPDYSDTLNRALLQVIDESGADPAAFVGFALRPTVAPTVGQFYVATDVDVGAAWTTLTAAMVSDLTTAATGITKLGTVNTGVWQGTSIATTYTDAKIKTVTGTVNRLSIGGTATDPVFDISSSYVGQATITTLGTIATGVWNATSIGTAYTDAKVVSLTGVTNRTTITGTATVPIVDIAATYVGQTSITTLGVIATGTWQGTAIADTYLVALSASKLTGTTLPSNLVTSSLTAVGTIATGVWQGTSISTTYTDAKIASVTGTANRITIGGTASAPTFDISAAYIGQATITTLGTIATGTWAATTISVDKGGTGLTAYTIGDTLYASGATTLAKLGIGSAGQFKVVNAGATAPQWHTLVTADITDLASATTGITKLGTVTTGIWNAGVIPGTYGGTGVNNGASTITLGGSLATSGAFGLTLTLSALTNVTLPTTGTLVNTAVTTLSSLTTAGSLVTVGALDSGSITSGFGSINIGADAITAGAASFTTVNASGLVTASGSATALKASPTNGVGNVFLQMTAADSSAYGRFEIQAATLGLVVNVATFAITATAVTTSGTLAVTSSGTWLTGTATATTRVLTLGGGYGVLSVGQTSAPASLAASRGMYGFEGDTNLYINSLTGGGVNINVNAANIGTFGSTGLAMNSLAISGVTTLGLSGQLASSVGNTGTVILSNGASTGYIVFADVQSTGGRFLLGIERSTGGGNILSGSSAYATCFGTVGATALCLGTAGATRLTLSSSGDATFSGLISASASMSILAGTYLNLYNAAGNTAIQLQNSGASGVSNLLLNGVSVSGITTLATSSTINGQTISSTASFTGSVAVGTSLTSSTIVATGAGLGYRHNPGAVNSAAYSQFTNNGGNYYIGAESSTGGSVVTGSAAFAYVIGTSSNRSIQIAPNDSVIASFTTVGMIMPTTAKLAFNVGATTYIYEPSVSEMFFAAGGSQFMRFQAPGVLVIGSTMVTTNASAGNLLLQNSSAPAGNPTGGIFIWAESGAGKARGTSGTVTTWAPAEPHCPVCGSDFGFEWENAAYGGKLQVCMKCLVEDVAQGKAYVRHIH